MKIKLLWFTAIIAIASVMYAVVPLFGASYIPTHDGEYHIVRIVEFARVLATGNPIPRWAPDMNSGYGIPIFNYHYPLPSYIGSFVRVFTRDAVTAFQMSQGVGYIALALAAFGWLSALFGTFPAIVGAVVAVHVPYLFVDLYVRGSIGEVWATVFLFLVLLAVEKKKYVWIAFSYGLLILSHNIMAMIYSPFIFGYAFIRNRKALLWMLGGVGLSAFFWLPAILESKYVVGLNTVNFREHFVELYELLVPSWGTGFSGTGVLGSVMSVQIGIVPLLAIFAAMLTKSKGDTSRITRYFVAVFALAVIMMLPVSRPVWEMVTPLQFIQYPWRLLSFVIPVAGFSAAYWVSTKQSKWWGISLMLLSIALSFTYARPVFYAPRNEQYYMSRPNFTDGTSSMGNSFSTIWTGWKDTRATEGATLYFPGWKAYVGDREVPITNDNGVIQVTSSAILRFTETPVRWLADIISVVSLITLILCALL